MSYNEQKISDLIDGGIEKEKEFISSINSATEAFKSFNEVASQFPQSKRQAKIEKHESDIQTEILENIFDNGSICSFCCRNPNTCEGASCAESMNLFLEFKTKNEIAKMAFEAIGEKWKNQSIRIKNFIKNEK